MALPGVGVFPGENPEFIVRLLREAGFPVKAVWAQVSYLQVPFTKNRHLFNVYGNRKIFISYQQKVYVR